jgi:hypothetical protein
MFLWMPSGQKTIALKGMAIRDAPQVGNRRSLVVSRLHHLCDAFAD